jgi:hypothetical protein
LQVGQVLPALNGRAVDGSAVSVPMLGQRRPTLVYVFAGGCGWCDANRANVTALVAAVRDTHRLVLVSRDGAAPEYVRVLATSAASLVVTPREDTLKAYHMIAVPQTIVVGPDGAVTQHWIGAYTGPLKTQVEGFAGVALPGVEVASLSSPGGCRDDAGGVYSPGAIEQIGGLLHRCGTDGKWTPYSHGESSRQP